MNISTVVKNYIAEHRPKLALHLAHYSCENAPSFEEAIRRAAYAEWDETGRKHGHQYRLPKAASAEVKTILLNARTRLNKCTSFLELFKTIRELILPVSQVGELMVYDTSLRLGHYLELEPDHVFVQSGVTEGAKAFFDHLRPHCDLPKARYVDKSLFLPEFEELDAKEIENLLCTNAAVLKGLPVTTRKSGSC